MYCIVDTYKIIALVSTMYDVLHYTHKEYQKYIRITIKANPAQTSIS